MAKEVSSQLLELSNYTAKDLSQILECSIDEAQALISQISTDTFYVVEFSFGRKISEFIEAANKIVEEKNLAVLYRTNSGWAVINPGEKVEVSKPKGPSESTLKTLEALRQETIRYISGKGKDPNLFEIETSYAYAQLLGHYLADTSLIKKALFFRRSSGAEGAYVPLFDLDQKLIVVGPEDTLETVWKRGNFMESEEVPLTFLDNVNHDKVLQHGIHFRKLESLDFSDLRKVVHWLQHLDDGELSDEQRSSILEKFRLNGWKPEEMALASDNTFDAAGYIKTALYGIKEDKGLPFSFIKVTFP
jgi:hypothetical protein